MTTTTNALDVVVLPVDQGGTGTTTSTGTGSTVLSNSPTFTGTVTLPSGTITYTQIQNESSSTLLGNPTGSAAAPSEITLGSGLSFSGSTLVATGTGGTVTSVSGTGTVSGLTLTGTVTTSGSLTLGGTLSVLPSNFSSQSANTFLAAPNGSSGTPTFRAIIAADIPTLNQNTTGTAANITATSNSTLTTLSSLSLPATQLTGTLQAAQFPALTGDVTTVAGSLTTHVVSYGGGTSFGTMAAQNASSVNITGGTITGMPTPSGGSDVATKSYVDNISASLNIHASVEAATTANLTATYTAGTIGADGGYGVGATLTNSGTKVEFTTDGYSAVLGDRILVKNESNPDYNGVYTVTTLGSGSVNWVLTRATDYDNHADATEVEQGDFIVVINGTLFGTTAWIQTAPSPTVIGSTAINFVQFSGAQPILTYTGDVTGSGTVNIALTLDTVNSNIGSFGSSTAIPNFTVNAKGLITAAGTSAVVAPAGTLTGTTLASNVVSSSLTSVGTIGTGTWQGSVIQPSYIATLNQNTTGTAANITATSNSTLTTLSALTSVGTITSGTWSGSFGAVSADTVLGNPTGSSAAPTYTAAPVLGTSLTAPLIIGGTTASSTLTLESTSGTGTSDKIIFKTGSQATAMTINTSGQVGIGTTPVGSYQLSAVQAGSNQAYFGSTGSNNSNVFIDTAASGNASQLVLSSQGVNKWLMANSTANTFALYDIVGSKSFVTMSTSGSLILGPAQTTYISQSGNVGIGTSTTTYQLNVAATGFPQAYFVNSGTTQGQIAVDNSAGGQGSYINFMNAAANKWSFGINTLNQIQLSDLVGSKAFLVGVTGGSLYLGPAQNMTIDQTGVVTISGQLIAKGTATNDSAASGQIGEEIISTVGTGAAVSLTTNVSTSITSIILTAGDWDISGKIGWFGGTGTTFSYLFGDINTTAGAGTNSDTGVAIGFSGTLGSSLVTTQTINTRRISIASSTTYYLNTLATFGTSTCKGFGIIRARRMR